MPGLFKMTDAKDASYGTPVVISQVAADAPKPRNTKKIIIIAASSVLGVAIILTAILVGMYLFSRGQQDILKYTLNVDKDTKQEVTSDPNENVNKYNLHNSDNEVWTVDDFNRDIRVTKIQTKTDTNCYVVPLNRTSTVEPSQMKPPSNTEVKGNRTIKLYYDVSSTPIADTSFLGRTAKETCKGISVYWLYPKCSDDQNAVQRKKRTTYYYKCTPVACIPCDSPRICYEYYCVRQYYV